MKNLRPLLNRPLQAAGIQVRQFWLLADLFQTLTDRREAFGQLGREGTALKSVVLVYFLFSTFGAMLWSLAQPTAGRYLSIYLITTGFLMFTMLLPETGNSLINATEALVLSHRPIPGRTYTAAKLAHLAKLVVFLAAGLNGGAAIVGLTLPGATWLYPLQHMALALLVGTFCALFCCALYGWLLRLVAPGQLKLISNLLEALPFPLAAFGPRAIRAFHPANYLPADPQTQRLLLAALATFALLVLVFGLRSLSTDFLLRVAGIVHGGRTRTWQWRFRWSPADIAAWSGGQPARAAYSYTAAMMRRDWQFRRQLFAMAAALLLPLGGILTNLRVSPFHPEFAAAHALPHALGFAMFLICTVLPFGNQPQAAWAFLLAPPDAWPRFAQGLHTMLWTWMVLVPHALLLAVALHYWPPADVFLFTGYSLALASGYLAANLQMLEYIPFTRTPQPDRGPTLLLEMFAGGIFIAILVALQYFLIFRARVAVPIATILFAGIAWIVTRWSLAKLTISMQFGLARESGEVTAMYTEID